MAILQFMASGLDRTAVPTSIHCDHLIVGNKGAKEDLKVRITFRKSSELTSRHQLTRTERFLTF
jgi:hypothetical protein